MRKKDDTRLRDWDIREAFVKRNLDFFKSTTFVNEMGVNSKNIVDLAALDFDKNIFYGFEIKSEVDSLKRLYKQLSTYTSFFNIVYVVAHEKHTEHILELLENNSFAKNVGYIAVSSNLEFLELKKGKMVTPRFDLFLRNLDEEEMENLCKEKGKFAGWESKSMLVDKIKRFITYEDIYEHLHNKVIKYYDKTCMKCGSKLYHNKRDRNGKLRSYCYECGSEVLQD